MAPKLRGTGRRYSFAIMRSVRWPCGRRRRLSIVALVLAPLASSGCGEGRLGNTRTASTTRQHSVGRARANPHYGAPGASVSFLVPKPGSKLADPVHVRVVVRRFKLDPARLDKAPRQGEGNLQFRMDGGKYDTPRYAGANGRLAVRLGLGGKYSLAVTPEMTYTGLPRGRHTLVVFLANNDLSQTGVRGQVVFSVR